MYQSSEIINDDIIKHKYNKLLLERGFKVKNNFFRVF